jgi:molecular chaperone GrpE
VSSHKEKDEGKERESRRSGASSSGGPSGGADLEGSDPAVGGNSRQAGDEGGSSNEQFQKILSEKQELANLLVRLQADFENYRKRVEKERQRDRHRGVEALIEHILPVLDAFDRALAPEGDSGTSDYRKGFELIRRQLWDALAKQGLVRIESVGKEFDPHFHHAIERVETTSHADGQVIEELQPGYVFHDRVLRPAMVRVAVEPQGRSARISVNED